MKATRRDSCPESQAAAPWTSRRNFVKLTASCMAAAATGGAASVASAADKGHHGPKLDPDRCGMLIDLTVCIGCRRCEWACCEANDLQHGPMEEFDDPTVFEETRRPSSTRLTVVNRFEREEPNAEPTHAKIQCMHCEHPACVSACLVGAMRKQPDGPVTYDAGKCIGCRYCMVACPHQLPAYEYEKALTPRVMKCTLCRERAHSGKLPACAEICPVEALQYGEREELLRVARERIHRHPDRYVDHIYGEHEAGGTSCLYLSDRPFQELGFPTLDPDAPPALTETIQHGIFKGFAAPLLLGGLLAAISKLSQSREH
jgi:Fe-S-cluster-containing dehydrogenase component